MHQVLCPRAFSSLSSRADWWTADYSARLFEPLPSNFAILPWLAWQMSAETMWQALNVITFLLLGMSRLRLYTVVVTAQYVSFLGIGLWASAQYGAAGLIASQFASGFITFAFGV